MAQSPVHSGFTAVVTVTAVLFFLVLLPFELIPEIPVDIDFKPFFVPLALCALLPTRMGLAIGLDVALGEGMRDLMEGYELDDPIGFFGYVAGFWEASNIYAISTRSWISLALGALVCGFVQAAIEATSFLLFGMEGLAVTVESTLGNTITHGLICGAIPVLFLVPALRGQFEYYLGFSPKGTPEPPPLTGGDPDFVVPTDALAHLSGASFRYPGAEVPSLQQVSLAISTGDIVGIVSDNARAAEAAGLVIAGLAPRVTGGELAGEVTPPKRVAILSHDPRDQTTQATPEEEVAAIILLEGGDPEAALAKARSILSDFNIPSDRHDSFIWTLEKDVQFRVHLAVARAAKPELLLIQRPSLDTSPEALALLQIVICEQLSQGAVIITGTSGGPFMDRARRVLRLNPDGVAEEIRPEAIAPKDVPRAANGTAIRSPDEDVWGVDVPTLQTCRSRWWKERDPRLKWSMFLSILALIYIVPTWQWMAALTAVGLLLTLTTRPPLLWLSLALVVQLPNILGLIFLPLVGAAAIGEEFGFGLRLGLGWVAAILFGISLLSTMPVPQLVAGLRGLGLPRRFSAMIGQVFVMIYLSFADIAKISRESRQKAKSENFLKPFQLIGGLSKLFVPSIVAITRRSAAMAIALDIRDNGRGTPPFVQKPPGIVDGLLLLGTMITLSAAIVARLGI